MKFYSVKLFLFFLHLEYYFKTIIVCTLNHKTLSCIQLIWILFNYQFMIVHTIRKSLSKSIIIIDLCNTIYKARMIIHIPYTLNVSFLFFYELQRPNDSFDRLRGLFKILVYIRGLTRTIPYTLNVSWKYLTFSAFEMLM
jgi:hypothetical protein